MNLTYTPLKRVLDIIIVLLLLITFLPIWLLIPILVFITSPGPTIFRHKRLGKGGSEFKMLKFRTMVINADDILHKQDPKLLKKFKDNDWKLELKADPRITQLGRILRTLTIDEFPQLLNVLKGEMSMVGPRAYTKQELDEQLKKYPQSKKHIKSVMLSKPGITGLWQVSGRNVISFDKRAKLDAQYVKEMSLWNDLKILLRTPKAMISKW